jgi:hypothetical protein
MTPALRSPDEVMRLERLGAAHPTRLSFLRALLRRVEAEGWTYSRTAWAIDPEGFGHAVLTVSSPRSTYSLVGFSTPLADEMRTDRVIAEAWDTSYVLYDGVPTASEIERLRANAPRQEAGRFTERDLVLARANKSVRLFAHVADSLAAGRQPDAALLAGVGYLMRTTAVYGNGKFGIADRDRIAGRPELAGPFRAEMLAVWLIRSFTLDLVEHVAVARGGASAARLDPDLRRSLGVGNSTGLGMAPFLVRHPLLVHRWFHARETALARVRALPAASEQQQAAFRAALVVMRSTVARWHTEDPVQAPRVARLAADLDALAEAAGPLLVGPAPWNALYRHAEANLSMEGQEAVVALVLEPNGPVVDDLADTMDADEDSVFPIDGRMTVADLRARLGEAYAWVRRFDFTDPANDARFWYVSEEKLEPRLGERREEEEGAEREQPLAVARDMSRLIDTLAAAPAGESLAAFLMRRPDFRHLVRRAQIAVAHPYAEVRDNLVAAGMRPVDLLRAKLAFFGASRFDPRSDRWLRIALFADAPFPDEICRPAAERMAS